jgi:predicted nuclease of restriction endonuclease-like RecB superfamily
MSKKKPKKTEPRNNFEKIIDKSINALSHEMKLTYEYEPQNYVVQVEVTYKPDWVVQGRSGPVIIEGKGYFRDEDRKKVLAFTQQYPEYRYHIVFERDNPIYKGSKYRYSDWCEKHSISYSIKSLPKGLFE